MEVFVEGVLLPHVWGMARGGGGDCLNILDLYVKQM